MSMHTFTETTIMLLTLRLDSASRHCLALSSLTLEQTLEPQACLSSDPALTCLFSSIRLLQGLQKTLTLVLNSLCSPRQALSFQILYLSPPQ